MKLLTVHVFAIVLAMSSVWQAANAQTIQHSDVFFVYGETQIEIGEQDGRLAFPQIMPQGDFFFQANGNPGFYSEQDVGGGTAPNDRIGYNVLDDLVFWTDGEFTTPRADTQIRIVNNPSSVDDTIVGNGTGVQRASFNPLLNSIGTSSDAGDFHSHVDYLLEPRSSDPEETPPNGAYGIKLSLSSNNPVIQDSEPFFLVWRFGMDQSDFVTALDDFDAMLRPSSVLGDFDTDGVLTAVDIDLLSQAVLAGSSNQEIFDLTSDSTVNDEDRKAWVEELKGTLFGDADLNGSVEFADFLVLSTGFGMNGGWADGDFDGNGQIQFADFLLLSAHFGEKAAAAATVPEPSAKTVAYPALLAIVLVRRRRRSLNEPE